jgi:Cu/Ag efflux pump CusA
LVRGLGRARGVDDLAAAVVRVQDGIPLRVRDLASVQVGPEPQRGTAAYKTRAAVILSVQKQPGTNTLELTREIDHALKSVAGALPEGVLIETENFRQADFIEVAIHNVSVALRDGGILVVVILFLFLGNLRTTFISGISIPLSLVLGILVISLFGGTINTMTLGGMTIAIGALVDNAIVGVENVLRRLRDGERGTRSAASLREVVFRASSEVLRPKFFATLIIIVVFVPLFFLPGLEGRLLRPLGFAYVAGLAASFFVSLTVTPVLCFFLLPGLKNLAKEPLLLRVSRRSYRSVLDRALGRRWAVIVPALGLLVLAFALVPSLDRSFLPPFNEGSLPVSVVSPPGIPLAESDRLGS